MSQGSVEEDNPTLATTSALAVESDINAIRHCNPEDIRQGDDNAAQLLTDSSSLVQTHAVSDPIFAPVRKLPPEILAKIFVECIPSLVHERPSLSFDSGMHLQQVRARIGQVCRVWNAILIDEPGVWATLVLDNPPPALEIVSLWIKRSKSHPLDVSLLMNNRNGYVAMDARDAVVKMLHGELWRIRSFVAEFINHYEISPLFPPDLTTEAPMMQSLTLQCLEISPEGRLGRIHCPQLRTLTLRNCHKAVEFLMSEPMQNLHVLTIINSRFANMLYIKLLGALPNLVSLTWWWGDFELPLHDEIPRIALSSLKSLAFRNCHWEITSHLLRHLDVPSLEHLDLQDFFGDREGSLNMVLDAICDDGAVQLRRLTLGNGSLRGANFNAMWHHLKHLEILLISDAHSIPSADELFISLSPPNGDFSSVCPQLKTLEISYLQISTVALVDFVQRRVKSDLGGPGLVTCLKLLDMWVDEEVSAQLAKTHGLSVHVLPID